MYFLMGIELDRGGVQLDAHPTRIELQLADVVAAVERANRVATHGPSTSSSKAAQDVDHKHELYVKV
jgi:hypothetical protein